MLILLKFFLVQACFISSTMSLPQRLGSTQGQECRVKEVSTGQLKPCIFPFTYSQRVFTSCTTFADPQNKHWCSTKVDRNGRHVGKIDAFGHCDMSNDACSGKAPTPSPQTAVLDQRQEPTIVEDFSDDSKGTWKPLAENGDCGVKYPGGFLVGGEVALPGEFPYMALLGYKIDDENTFFLCGGTIINRYYVLTAAHCQTGKHKISNVVLGENVVNVNPDCTPMGCLPSVQDIEVESVTVHENWDKNKVDAGNDIALIRLAKPARFYTDEGKQDSSASPICLPWKSTFPGFDLSSVSNATVSGWGRITNDADVSKASLRKFKVSTQNLMKASLPIVDADRCKAISKLFSAASQICAGGGQGVDSCNGDSGGPLAYKTNGIDDPWYLIGIVSFGTKICGIGTPGVYTKVTSYLDWIERNMKP